MSRLLPFKSEPTRSPEGARVLSLEDEATEDALSALSSDTAREVLALIYEEPRTPPEIRDAIDTSLQNVHYHLENLEEADLIQPAGSGYSEKGTEMTVYAPASEAVVLFAGAEDDGSRIQTALARLLGAVGLLALASIAVRRVARTTLPVSGLGGGDGGEGAATPASQSGGGTDTAAPEGADGGDGGGMGALDQEATPTPEATSTPEATPTSDPAGTPATTSAQTETPIETSTPTPRDTPAATPDPSVDEITTPTPEPTLEPTGTATPTQSEAWDAIAAGDGGLLADPAVAFFLGGLFMLAVAGAWWYLGR
ncbi:ArsR family transcriptional regulator [Halobacteriales archaeon QH_1_68_42]|nr:MAG: ArsR family transcriptional regulator [Halobacteriales archaeon QH_1_68_42]